MIDVANSLDSGCQAWHRQIGAHWAAPVLPAKPVPLLLLIYSWTRPAPCILNDTAK